VGGVGGRRRRGWIGERGVGGGREWRREEEKEAESASWKEESVCDLLNASVAKREIYLHLC